MPFPTNHPIGHSPTGPSTSTPTSIIPSSVYPCMASPSTYPTFATPRSSNYTCSLHPSQVAAHPPAALPAAMYSSPIYSSPMPVYSSPLPIYSSPLPVYSSPLPVYSSPLLVYSSPLPVYSSPLPVYSSPLPVYSSPLPVYSSPLPVYSSPLPVYSSPLPVYSSPLPVYSSSTSSSSPTFQAACPTNNAEGNLFNLRQQRWGHASQGTDGTPNRSLAFPPFNTLTSDKHEYLNKCEIVNGSAHTNNDNPPFLGSSTANQDKAGNSNFKDHKYILTKQMAELEKNFKFVDTEQREKSLGDRRCNTGNLPVDSTRINENERMQVSRNLEHEYNKDSGYWPVGWYPDIMDWPYGHNQESVNWHNKQNQTTEDWLAEQNPGWAHMPQEQGQQIQCQSVDQERRNWPSKESQRIENWPDKWKRHHQVWEVEPDNMQMTVQTQTTEQQSNFRVWEKCLDEKNDLLDIQHTLPPVNHVDKEEPRLHCIMTDHSGYFQNHDKLSSEGVTPVKVSQNCSTFDKLGEFKPVKNLKNIVDLYCNSTDFKSAIMRKDPICGIKTVEANEKLFEVQNTEFTKDDVGVAVAPAETRKLEDQHMITTESKVKKLKWNTGGCGTYNSTDNSQVKIMKYENHKTDSHPQSDYSMDFLEELTSSHDKYDQGLPNVPPNENSQPQKGTLKHCLAKPGVFAVIEAKDATLCMDKQNLAQYVVEMKDTMNKKSHNTDSLLKDSMALPAHNDMYTSEVEGSCVMDGIHNINPSLDCSSMKSNLDKEFSQKEVGFTDGMKKTGISKKDSIEYQVFETSKVSEEKCCLSITDYSKLKAYQKEALVSSDTNNELSQSPESRLLLKRNYQQMMDGSTQDLTIPAAPGPECNQIQNTQISCRPTFVKPPSLRYASSLAGFYILPDDPGNKLGANYIQNSSLRDNSAVDATLATRSHTLSSNSQPNGAVRPGSLWNNNSQPVDYYNGTRGQNSSSDHKVGINIHTKTFVWTIEQISISVPSKPETLRNVSGPLKKRKVIPDKDNSAAATHDGRMSNVHTSNSDLPIVPPVPTLLFVPLVGVPAKRDNYGAVRAGTLGNDNNYGATLSTLQQDEASRASQENGSSLVSSSPSSEPSCKSLDGNNILTPPTSKLHLTNNLRSCDVDIKDKCPNIESEVLPPLSSMAVKSLKDSKQLACDNKEQLQHPCETSESRKSLDALKRFRKTEDLEKNQTSLNDATNKNTSTKLKQGNISNGILQIAVDNGHHELTSPEAHNRNLNIPIPTKDEDILHQALKADLFDVVKCENEELYAWPEIEEVSPLRPKLQPQFVVQQNEKNLESTNSETQPLTTALVWANRMYSSKQQRKLLDINNCDEDGKEVSETWCSEDKKVSETWCSEDAKKVSETWCSEDKKVSETWCSEDDKKVSETWCSEDDKKVSETWCSDDAKKVSKTWCSDDAKKVSETWCSEVGKTVSETWCPEDNNISETFCKSTKNEESSTVNSLPFENAKPDTDDDIEDEDLHDLGDKSDLEVLDDHSLSPAESLDGWTHADQLPFRCEFCGRLFKHKRSRDRHVKLHTGDKKYKCCHCDAAFSRSDHLKIHKKTHDTQKPYQCNVCNRGYNTAAALTAHMQNHKAKLTAHTLNQLLKDAQAPGDTHTLTHVLREPPGESHAHALNSYLKDTHKDRQLASPRGGGEVGSGSSPGEHLTASPVGEQSPSLSPAASYRCPVCHAPCRNHAHLQRHVARHHGEDIHERPASRSGGSATSSIGGASSAASTPSPRPPSSLPSPRPLSNPLLSLVGGKLACLYCSRDGFPSLEALQLHLQSSHGSVLNGEMRDMTSILGLPASLGATLGASGLPASLASPLGPGSSRGVSCELCGARVGGVTALQRHVVTAHTFTDLLARAAEGVFCAQCLLPFSNPGALAEHIKLVHAAPVLSAVLNKRPPSPPNDIPTDLSKKSRHDTLTSDLPASTLLCSQCNAPFTNFEAFRRHLKSHLDGAELSSSGASSTLLSCPECRLPLTSETSLETHLASHLGITSTEYGCQACLKLFSKPDELQKHLMDIHAHHLYRCSLCKEMFDSKVSIQVHFAVKHSNECLVHKCTRCSLIFRSQSEFEGHIRSSHIRRGQCGGEGGAGGGLGGSGGSYRCLLCTLNLSSEAELAAHVATHQRQFQCSLCDDAFHVEFLLDKHMQTQHNSELNGNIPQPENLAKPRRSPLKKDLRCDICDADFSSDSTLVNHRKQAHNIKSGSLGITAKVAAASLSLFCAYCSEVCKSRGDLEAHMKSHQGNGGRHKCNICDELCPSAALLAQHKLTHVKVISGSACAVCREPLTSEQQFTSHQNDHHPAPLPQPCVVCRQTLVTDMEVSVHARFHAAQAAQAAAAAAVYSNSELLPPLSSSVITTAALSSTITSNSNNGRSSSSPRHSPSLRCPECHLKLETVEEAEAHAVIHHQQHQGFGRPQASSSRTYQCIKCQESFASEAEIESHVASHLLHEGSVHECHLCRATFDTPLRLQCHLIEHTFEGCGSFTCYMCSSVYTTASRLQQHMVEHGLSARPYDCHHCHQRFFFRAELENHALTHPEAAEGGCRECLASFPDLLRRSMRRQTFSSIIGNHHLGSHLPPLQCKIEPRPRPPSPSNIHTEPDIDVGPANGHATSTTESVDD